MKVDALLDRARSALGLKTVYVLGGGNTDPLAPDPLDDQHACDCSAFVCWALQLRKYQPTLAFLKAVNGGWLNTDGMWWDGNFNPVGFFSPAGGPRPGAVVVYPAAWAARSAVRKEILLSNWGAKDPQPTVGHVGIVIDDDHVIHCSGGNYRKGEDAIAITGHGVFVRVPYVSFLLCSSVDYA